MELGKVQKQWVGDLRQFPERQCIGKLGFKDDNNQIKACCLGQGLLTLKSLGLIEFDIYAEIENKFEICDRNIHNEIRTSYPENSFHLLGLRDERGDFDGDCEKINNKLYNSLSQANDDGVSWLDIANFIEENPEVVFTRSV